MDLNRQSDKRNQNENYLPSEIPIPDMKNTRSMEVSNEQSAPHQGENIETPYGQNNPYQGQGMQSPYGQSDSYQGQKDETPYGNSISYQGQNGEMPYGNSVSHQGQNIETPYGQNYQYQGPMYVPKEPKSGIAVKILIAAVCAVVVIFAAVGIGIAYFRSTPAYRLGRAFFNLSREIEEIENPLAEKIGAEDIMLMMVEEGSHISTKMNFTSESLYGTTVGVDTECYKDVPNKELSADTSISMMNYELAHLNIYADDEALCFSIPELFMENMYIDNENVVGQYNSSFLAELTGIIDAEDFSIHLFADEDERLSLREWRDVSSFAERYEEDIANLKDKLVLEKAEKGFYRIVYPAREMDHLLKNIMDNYEALYEVAGEEEWWKEYDRLIDSDVSVLFEIDRQNRIDSIAFEAPVKMLDGTASMEASLHFLGDVRSIDKMQGELVVESGDGVERSIHFQVLHTPSEDAYGLDMDLELMEEKDSLLRMKMVSNSDAVQNEFDMNFSMWDDEEDVELILEGSLDDIVRGRSLKLDLEEISFHVDGEEMFKITGDVSVEPLEGEVTSTVKKGTAFFEMTEDDWLDILYEISDEYGGFLDYLW